MTKVRSGDRAISKKYKYQAFISYAHKDEAVAARLHRALETYRIPKNTDVADEKSLSPIFRDTAELTAHHSLSEKIREAVQGSRVLIVICSPAAKASHWVNEEIRLFRALHGEGSILCVLAEGTPETSFPRALIEEGREPLAANLGASKESFRLGTTQLAASMLGVGLDVLIQRESKRRRRRLQLITASALIFSGVMGATTLTAIDARNDAQNSRSQAEGLVEYMITDLKDKLEPVGRLDILDSVGDEAVKYYDAQNIEGLSDESLTRQASARHILGQVALDAGDLEKARHEIEAAAAITAEILNRNPNDDEAIYAHAQSEFWVGKIYHKQKNSSKVYHHWKRYNDLSQRLYLSDPMDFEKRMEASYGHNNLGNIALIQKDYPQALSRFNSAIDLDTETITIFPEKRIVFDNKANALAGASKALLRLNEKEMALKYRLELISIYEVSLKEDPKNYAILFKLTNARATIIEQKIIPQGSKAYDEIALKTQKGFEALISRDKENIHWKREYDIFLKSLN